MQNSHLQDEAQATRAEQEANGTKNSKHYFEFQLVGARERYRAPVLEPEEVAFLRTVFGVRVVEFSALVVRWIPNEVTLLHVGA